MNDIVLPNEERMQAYIIVNLNRIQQLIKPYKKQKQELLIQEESIWHNDINKQYKTLVTSIIVLDMCQNLPNLNAFDAMEFIERMDIFQL